MGQWTMNPDERDSFSGGCYRFGTIGAGTVLYSFSSFEDRPTHSDQDRGYPRPMYFMHESSIKEVLGAPSRKANLQDLIRQGVALCEEWNSMRYLFILEVGGDDLVEAWFGTAKRQVKKSFEFRGGWLQYIVRVNQHLSPWLRGPIRTGW